MHIELLLEEPSAEAALSNLLPKIVPPGCTFAMHPHPGKPALLRALPDRLRAYRRWMPGDYRIAVLVDQDRQDCHALKGVLEKAALDAGSVTRTSAGSAAPFQVLNRIAIEELEAWFFGDVEALCAAFPRVPTSLGDRSKYRQPDEITGGTAEALERELRRAGYYPSGAPKIEPARHVSAHMDPARNRSHSFRVFVEGMRQLAR